MEIEIWWQLESRKHCVIFFEVDEHIVEGLQDACI